MWIRRTRAEEAEVELRRKRLALYIWNRCGWWDARNFQLETLIFGHGGIALGEAGTRRIVATERGGHIHLQLKFRIDKSGSGRQRGYDQSRSGPASSGEMARLAAGNSRRHLEQPSRDHSGPENFR